ncbi:tyrosine-type recombinase/integrase [Actinomycetospora callitridis]|uniref:tyrosine-type recombinase/integrase n=1 Tax=Actinomycetospora callitridis TaxID=913944 RepID=UPI0023661DF9|nr:site-specific integrase [Actinomycetospora callitridis]MDD7920992.1 site-specific integrase [Actinomycetospora callitridis]
MATEKPKRRGRRANGEGTITRRKDGLWQAAIYVPQPDGTTKRKFIYNRDRDALRDELTDLAYKIGKGIPAADAKVSVGDYLDGWLAEIKPHIRPATYTGYETNVRLHIKPLVGTKRLDKLGARDVRMLVEVLRSKPVSRGQGTMSDRAVQYVHATLRAALEQAVREELVARNVAKLVRSTIRDAREHEPWTPEESTRFLKTAAEHRLTAMWVLLVVLGLRRGEVLALRWSDLDTGAETLSVLGSLQRVGERLERMPTKTRGSTRTIPLPARAARAVAAHRVAQGAERAKAGERWVDSGLMFTTAHGTPVEPRTINRMFRTLSDATGLRPVRVHDLRHGAVSLLLALGVPPRTVMQVVGHTVMEMTMERYGHVNLDEQRAAVERLDRVFGEED